MKAHGLYTLNQKIKLATFALLSSTALYCSQVYADIEQNAHSTNSDNKATSELLNVRIADLALQQQKGRILSIDPQDGTTNCYRVKVLSQQGKLHILDNICDS